jgi:hypothetical protein
MHLNRLDEPYVYVQNYFTIIVVSLFVPCPGRDETFRGEAGGSVSYTGTRVDAIDPKIFRAFVPHPVGAGAAYYHFHELDSSMNGYYTSGYPDPPPHELGNYLSQPIHSTNQTIQTKQVDAHNLVFMVVAPIYDILVDQMLNPLIQSRLPPGTVIPIPTLYVPNQPVKPCADMKTNPDPKPTWFGGKKNKRAPALARQSRRGSRMFRRRTMKKSRNT